MKKLFLLVSTWALLAVGVSAQDKPVDPDAGVPPAATDAPAKRPPSDAPAQPANPAAPVAPEAQPAPEPAPTGEPAPAPTEPAPAPPAEGDPFAAAEAELVEPEPGVEVVAPDESLFQAGGIDIVAPADDVSKTAPSSTYVIDEKRLERMNFDDANQVLVQVPGVYVRQEDGYGLRPNIGMRGADADRSKKITLMEDGVLFGPAPYSAPAAYYFPLLTRMVGVEVFKGARAIRFGPQTIGGGLDLRTREVPADGKVAAIDLSAGNTFYTKLHGSGGYGEENWGLLIEGVHLSSTGFKELDSGGDTGFGKQELMIKGRVNTAPTARVYQRLEPKLGYSHEDSNETYLGLTDEDFRKNPLRRYSGSRFDGFTYWRTQGELKHVLEVGGHFQLNTVVYQHDMSRLWKRVDGFVGEGAPSIMDVLDNPSGANQIYYDLLTEDTGINSNERQLLLAGNRRRFVSRGVQSVATYDFKTGKVEHELELGVRVHQDSIRRRHTATAYGFVDPDEDDLTNPLVLGEVRALPLLAHNQVETLATAIHGVYDLTFYGLTLSPGVRAEIIRSEYTEKLDAFAGDTQKFDPNVILFALGARYAVTNEVSLIAGAQQGITPVAPFIARDAGGSQLKIGKKAQTERAINYEAGLRYASAVAEASAIGFLSDYDNVVSPCEEQCASSDTGSYSSGKALVYGAELGGQGRLTLPRGYGMPLQGSYTYTHAEFTEDFDSKYPLWGNVKAGFELPYIPAHQFALGAGVDYQKKMGVDLLLTFVDRMREIAGEGELETGKYTDRYALLDANVFYQALEKFRIYLKADNITNNQPIVSRRPFGARPNKPLLVQVGLKWEL